ncbi:MAG: DUF721 domain-containing protein [Rhodospirillales bacterium]|nr:DUF721 domain-containing protein [Rhodospirillales bacterium]
MAQQVGKITKPIFGGRGFSDSAIVNDWQLIAGEHLAGHSMPERITHSQGRKDKGTLHLRIDNGGLAMQLQHLEPVLIEKINAYFGFAAVERIRMTQGPLPERPKDERSQPRPLSEIEERSLSKCLSQVKDEDMQKALERLGRAILGKTFKEKP